jgi:hypothetical protein
VARRIRDVFIGKIALERWEFIILILACAGLMLDGDAGEVTGDIAFWLVVFLIVVHAVRIGDDVLYRLYHKRVSRGIDIRR